MIQLALNVITGDYELLLKCLLYELVKEGKLVTSDF